MAERQKDREWEDAARGVLRYLAEEHPRLDIRRISAVVLADLDADLAAFTHDEGCSPDCHSPACWWAADWGWSEADMKGEVRRYYISTGGWSGNEEILGVMCENSLFWSMCWYLSRRGGHYVFLVQERKTA